jgi:hypothetical protein
MYYLYKVFSRCKRHQSLTGTNKLNNKNTRRFSTAFQNKRKGGKKVKKKKIKKKVIVML